MWVGTAIVLPTPPVVLPKYTQISPPYLLTAFIYLLYVLTDFGTAHHWRSGHVAHIIIYSVTFFPDLDISFNYIPVVKDRQKIRFQ